MDEEPERPPTMPNALVIKSEATTRVDVDLESRPARGGARQLVLHMAMTECHTWVGIGGRTGRVRRPRRLTRQIPLLALDDDGDNHSSSSSSSSGGGGVDDCRRLIGRKIKDSLAAEEEYRPLTAAHWDAAVPRDIERALAVAVADAGTRVDISIRFEFLYSEANALLLACGCGVCGDCLARRSGSGDGDAPPCSICFEEMSPEAAGGEVAELPGCTHGFHRRCIAAWFRKTSTCPVCRRDQLSYLPPDYQKLHDDMKADPDSLQPDYL